MNKRRLLKLADLLEADAKNKKGVAFDLRAWAKKKVGGAFCRWAFEAKEDVEVNRNTAACAWGLAAISGAFKREGIGYEIVVGNLDPTFSGLRGIEAAQLFFGIDEDASEFLFMPYRYSRRYLTGAKGERYVAKRIRDFVAGKVTP